MHLSQSYLRNSWSILEYFVKNGPSEICGKQSLKDLKYGLLSSINFTWSISESFVPSIFEEVWPQFQLATFMNTENSFLSSR